MRAGGVRRRAHGGGDGLVPLDAGDPQPALGGEAVLVTRDRPRVLVAFKWPDVAQIEPTRHECTAAFARETRLVARIHEEIGRRREAARKPGSEPAARIRASRALIGA